MTLKSDRTSVVNDCIQDRWLHPCRLPNIQKSDESRSCTLDRPSLRSAVSNGDINPHRKPMLNAYESCSEPTFAYVSDPFLLSFVLGPWPMSLQM